jgi:hypothetical protein
VSKLVSVVKTWLLAQIRDKYRCRLESRRCGNRHREGMNAIQALIRNMRTCRPDVKGEAQAGNRKARVPMQGTGTDGFVVVTKFL